MHEELGYKLMGAAFEVYNYLGYGMAEEAYQECLEYELEFCGIPFLTKHEICLIYKDRPLRRKYVPDLFVADSLVVELKAHATLIADHEAQLFNYMRIARQPVGCLLNFGNKEKLEWKRFILSDLRAS
jgi:GxxExxY protein